MISGFVLFAVLLISSVCGFWLESINAPLWILGICGLLSLGWSAEGSRYILGVGLFGFWFRIITWIIAAVALMGILVGAAYGLIVGNWMMGAIAGCTIATVLAIAYSGC